MACLLDLPTEILLIIIQNLDEVSDLRSLSAASRRLYYVANPVLYSLAAKRYPYLLCWACGAGLFGVAEKLLVAGLSPNLPAVNCKWPVQFIDDDDSSLEKQRNNAESPPDVLNEVYQHHLSNSHLGGQDIQVVPYNPKIHSDVEEYIAGRSSYWFPLHAAAMSGHTGIMKLLFDYGAYLDPPGRGLCRCSPDGLGPLVQHWPRNYWTPLHVALCSRNELAANLLIKLGASPIVELCFRQSSALHWAARASFVSTTKLLLEGGPNASVDAEFHDPYYQTPLMWALGTENSIEIMTCLLQHGVNIDAHVIEAYSIPKYCEKPTALTQACYNGWHKDAIFLVNAGASVHLIQPRCPSALDQCFNWFGVRLNRDEEFRRFAITNMREMDNEDMNRLMKHHRRYGYKFSQLAIGPGPNDPNEDDNIAGMVELIRELIHSGANIHNSLAGTHYPLIRASARHLISIVELLQASGSDVNQEDDNGLFPLLAAISDANMDRADDLFTTVKYLLDHGADPNKANKFGQTVLMEICRSYEWIPLQLEMVKLLVGYGADINLRSPLYKSAYYPEYSGSIPKAITLPLQAAFHYGKYEIWRYLWDSGAEISHEKADLRLMLEDFVVNRREWEKGEEWDEWEELGKDDPPRCSNIYPTKRRREFCASLRVLLAMDLSGWLAKDPICLWLSTKLGDFRLTNLFLDAGASDASWSHEVYGSCLCNILDGIFPDKPFDIACVQRLVSLGADVNAVYRDRSILQCLFHLGHYQTEIEDGGLKRFIEFFTVLVDNGVIPTKEELECFRDMVELDRIHSDTDFWECRILEYMVLDTDFRLNLRRELRRRFVVENNKIVHRKHLTYRDVALDKEVPIAVTSSGSYWP
ncbi:ankyrin [Hypoxylon sp. FL1857]|nr:ankyrin [Hypoxylon sp. FL1857]